MELSTKDEAERLIIAGMEKCISGLRRLSILRDHTVVKPFGWVFFYMETTTAEDTPSVEATEMVRPIIVNRLSDRSLAIQMTCQRNV